MTRDEIRAALAKILSRIELRWPWKISPSPTIAGSEVLWISEEVPDRDSGELTTLGGMRYGLPPSLEEDQLVAWVYRQLERHVLHELAERFAFDGRRIFDPHAAEAARGADAIEDALAIAEGAEKMSLPADSWQKLAEDCLSGSDDPGPPLKSLVEAAPKFPEYAKRRVDQIGPEAPSGDFLSPEDIRRLAKAKVYDDIVGETNRLESLFSWNPKREK